MCQALNEKTFLPAQEPTIQWKGQLGKQILLDPHGEWSVMTMIGTGIEETQRGPNRIEMSFPDIKREGWKGIFASWAVLGSDWSLDIA